MTDVIFYEKVGCGNNTKQKAWLRAAGHNVIAKDLLTEPWTKESLQPYLTGLVVADWFNRAAPKVKNGEIIPEKLSAEQALAMLLAEPLLIRRPLMQVGDEYRMGFDADTVSAWLDVAGLPQGENLEACPRTQHPCATPESATHE